jgi:hypothetical protein
LHAVAHQVENDSPEILQLESCEGLGVRRQTEELPQSFGRRA